MSFVETFVPSVLTLGPNVCHCEPRETNYFRVMRSSIIMRSLPLSSMRK